MGFFKNVCCNIRGYYIRKSKHPSNHSGTPTKVIAGVLAGVLVIGCSGGAVLAHHFFDGEEELSAEGFSASLLKPPAMNFDFYEPSYVEIPNFVGMSIASDSLEKDLTLYFKGAESQSRIEGVNFTVKLIEPEQQKSLDEYLDAIDALNEQIAAAKADGSENDLYVAEEGNITTSSIDTPSTKVAGATHEKVVLTAAESEAADRIATQRSEAEQTIQANFDELTVGEKLLLDKQIAIQSYATALNAVEGDNFMDDDGDGMIYINKINSGKYVACMVPTGYYDPTDYATEVTVKDKVEYKKVENIKEKVKDASKVEDEKPADAAQQEAVLQDTVGWVESSKTAASGVYKETTTVGLAPAVVAGTTPVTQVYNVTTAARSHSKLTAAVNSLLGPMVVHAEETQPNTTGEGTTGTGESTTTTPDTPSTEPQTATASLLVPQSVTLYSKEGLNRIDGTVQVSDVASVTPVSDNNNISVSIEGNTVHFAVNGAVAESGSATVTYTAVCADGVTTFTATTAVTYVGAATPIRDAAGNELYLDQEGKTKATVANYSADGKFYAPTGEEKFEYTGWQTIDGKTYYYGADHKAVTGDQVIQGVQYSFNGLGVLVPKEGIDVSKWQGNIDWATASSYISFAVIRCGYRGESSRGLAIDPKFAQNVQGAKANGVRIGLYFYSTAMTEAEAVEEASLAVQCAQQAGGLALPIYIDMEAGCQAGLSNDERTAICNAFCSTVRNSGYAAGVYANKNWLTNKINTGAISGAEIWVAQYNTTCTYSGSKKMWQYTSKGSVPGISGEVDMNRRY